MYSRIVVPLLLLTASTSFAQVGTASRTVTLTPEEIVIDLVVSTATDLLPEQVAAHLSSLRIAQQDLKSVGTLRDDPDKLGWQYSIVRPFSAMQDTVRQLEYARRQLREKEVPMSYQFFLRASAKSIDAMKRRVLSELVAEAKRNAGGSGKLRSVTIDPTPDIIESGRPALLFGQPTGLLQFTFQVIVVLDNE